MTQSGGANGLGNVFSVGTDGAGYQNLLSFTGSSGAASGEYPEGSLILSGTALYGMTTDGGIYGVGNIFSVGLDGSGYQDLYNFAGGANGEYPNGDLLLSGGTLFGMTTGLNGGQRGGNGTVFAYTLPAPTPEPCTLALPAAQRQCCLERIAGGGGGRGGRTAAPQRMGTRPTAPTSTPSRP